MQSVRARGALGIMVAVTTTLLVASPLGAADQTKPRFNPPKAYYLALGDSLAYGYQQSKFSAGLPPPGFNTGYVDVFAARLRPIRPNISVVNYGCPGETTTSFIAGPCFFTTLGGALHDPFTGSQLDAAVAFLQAHPGQVSPITLNLWGNDIGAFVRSCEFNLGCIQAGAPAAINQIASRLALILNELRQAAPNAEFIVTGGFNVFPVIFGQPALFPLTDPLFVSLNVAIASVASQQASYFANVFPVFNPQGDLAAETAAICTLTLLCVAGDDHPSDQGYRAIADVIFDVSGYARLIE
jgi:lysophospholipase L1-like esterase